METVSKDNSSITDTFKIHLHYRFGIAALKTAGRRMPLSCRKAHTISRPKVLGLQIQSHVQRYAGAHSSIQLKRKSVARDPEDARTSDSACLC